MVNKTKLAQLKKMVALLEAKTGKRVSFVEKPKRRLNESQGSNLNAIVSVLQEMNSIIEERLALKPGGVRELLAEKISKAIQLATDGDELAEDVNMDVDTAIEHTDDLKKMMDKDVDVTITDGKDKMKI